MLVFNLYLEVLSRSFSVDFTKIQIRQDENVIMMVPLHAAKISDTLKIKKKNQLAITMKITCKGYKGFLQGEIILGGVILFKKF